MDNSGIISQFGFEYQKEVFINLVLNNLKSDTKIFYEYIDDISINDDDISIKEYDNLNQNKNNVNKIIQCKSGTITHNIIIKVFSNWMLLFDDDNIKEFILFLENEISFEYSEKSIKEALIENIKKYPNGKKKSSLSILYKLQQKYYDTTTLQMNEKFFNDFDYIFKHFKIEITNTKKIIENSESKFTATYSQSLHIETAKHLRFSRFRDKIYCLIRDGLLKKRFIKIDYKQFWNIVEECINEVKDEQYKPSYVQFRKESINKIEAIKKKLAREIKFFKKIKLSEEYVIELLINEMYYKYVKDYYISIDKTELASLAECIAKGNYIESKEQIYKPVRTLFFKTVEKNINAEFILNPKMNNGCYIFLSGDEAEDENFIDWSGYNERKNRC